MARFEVGRSYLPYGAEFDPIKIVRRTEKTIWCDNGQCQWRMRVRHDADGNEYAVDSCVPPRWREEFTYMAERVAT